MARRKDIAAAWAELERAEALLYRAQTRWRKARAVWRRLDLKQTKEFNRLARIAGGQADLRDFPLDSDP